MSGINETGTDPRYRFKVFSIMVGLKIGCHRSCIFLGVKGVNGWFASLGSFFVDIFGIRFVDMTGIYQHDVPQMSSWRGGVNGSFVPFFYQVRKVAAVVNVSMGKDDRIDMIRLEMEAAVALISLSPTPLVKTTFQEQLMTIDFK
jgi:hypothetical protein